MKKLIFDYDEYVERRQTKFEFKMIQTQCKVETDKFGRHCWEDRADIFGLRTAELIGVQMGVLEYQWAKKALCFPRFERRREWLEEEIVM